MPERQLVEGMQAWIKKTQGGEETSPAAPTEVAVGMVDILIYHLRFRLTDLTTAKWEAAYNELQNFLAAHILEIDFTKSQLEEKLKIIKDENEKKKLFR